MTKNPNIKAEILVWALAHEPTDRLTIDIPQFADEYGYEERRVCRTVRELYPLVECGTSPRYPWIGYKQLPKIHQRLKDWGYHD